MSSRSKSALIVRIQRIILRAEMSAILQNRSHITENGTDWLTTQSRDTATRRSGRFGVDQDMCRRLIVHEKIDKIRSAGADVLGDSMLRCVRVALLDDLEQYRMLTARHFGLLEEAR